jgi:hypothetical protein
VSLLKAYPGLRCCFYLELPLARGIDTILGKREPSDWAIALMRTYDDDFAGLPMPPMQGKGSSQRLGRVVVEQKLMQPL